MQTERPKARTSRDLMVWRKAQEFVLAVYRFTSAFPKSEIYGLVQQMRRAAVSIPANIAEGFTRRGKTDKAGFMNIAESSLVLCVLLLFWCGGALGKTSSSNTQEKTQASSAGDRQKPGEAQSQISLQNDPQLTKIDLFQIDLSNRLAGVQYKGSKSIHEVMNPFTARKRARIYGSLYEYHRNDNFDARNFFDPVGQKLPEYKRNQFGGSLGVFVTKQLTLFGTYDGLRINRGSTILSHVPTREMKQGDFSSLETTLVNPWTGNPFPGNRIPQSLFHPASVKMLTTMPDPNRNDPDRNFVNNQPEVDNRDEITVQADYKIGGDSKLFADYTLRNGNGFDVNPLPAFGLTTRSREQSVSVDFVRDFSSNLVASIQARFDREVQTELAPQAGNKGLLASLGIRGLSTLDDLDEGYPDFELSGYASLGSGDSPTTSYFNEYSLELGLTYVRKSHEFEFGMDIEAGQINNDRTGGLRRGSFAADGYYTGDAFADFLLGIPNLAERGVGSDRADVRRTSVQAFIADQWKVNPKLSVTASLAYDYTPFAHSTHDNVYAFAPLLFEPPPDGTIVRIGSEEAARAGLAGLKSGYAVFPDRNDWEPEIGLAYSPRGDNRLVVRASYELSHGSRDMDESFEVLGRSYPVYYTERAQASEDRPDLDLSNPFETAVPVELRIQGAEPRMRNSLTQRWQLSLENEIFPRWNIEVAYAGSRTDGSSRFIVANVPLPGPGPLQARRPNPNYGRFSILTSGGSSSGNALEASLRKRMSRGFSIEASYQWERNFSALGSSDPNNPRDLRAEWAPSSSPIHQFNVVYILDLPIGRGKVLSTAWAGKLRSLFEGWRISGITVFQSGDLGNPRMAGDPNNDGVRGDRPDRIASGELPVSQRSIDRWFDTGAFVAPPQYGFGNCGRNILAGPGKHNWDISFIKRTQVSREGNMVELRVQLFNAFNHANFNNPNTTVGTSLFGKIFGADRAREIEIAVKYTF